MVYRIVFSKEAVEDYDNIVAYYLDLIQNPPVLRKIVFEINRALDLIEQFPFSSEDFGDGLRKMHLRRYKYKLFYRVEGEDIVIESILHDFQDYSGN